MSKAIVWRCVGATLVVGFVCGPAAAWGPEAREGIMSTALQLLRREYSQQYWKDSSFAHQKDLFRGAEDGHQGLNGGQFGSLPEAVATIQQQIQLLREARTYGPGSYFSYRLGVLGALVADIYFPYALGTEPGKERLAQQLALRADELLDNVTYEVERRPLNFVRSPGDYFSASQRAITQAAVLIANNYANGRSYDANLKELIPLRIADAAEAVADIWNTVLLPDSSGVSAYGQPPSREALTWYFVNEIEYLLLVKDNPKEAEKAYRELSQVNPGIITAYEKVGDYFFKAGYPDRAVQEWHFAAEFSGPERLRVIEKLGSYYVDLGREYLNDDRMTSKPQLALDDAIAAFRQAITVDPTNSEASGLLQASQERLREVLEHVQEMIRIVQQMDGLMNEADRARRSGQYEVALNLYDRVQSLAEGVVDAPEQEESAEDMADDAAAQVRDILQDVLTEAQEALDEGDTAVERKSFDDAREEYESVAGILEAIPEGSVDARFAEEKQKLLRAADEKIQEANRAEERWKEEERRRREAEERGDTLPEDRAAPSGPEAGPGGPGMPGGPMDPFGMPGGF